MNDVTIPAALAASPDLSWFTKSVYGVIRAENGISIERLGECMHTIELDNAVNALITSGLVRVKIPKPSYGVKVSRRDTKHHEEVPNRARPLYGREPGSLLIASKRTTPREVEPEPVQEKQYSLIEYWNSLPNTRCHRTGTKTYTKATSLLNLLRTGGFGGMLWDDKWLEQKEINKECLAQRWKASEIRAALASAALMQMPGYWPDDKSWVPRDLPSLLYNPRRRTSWFLAMYANPPEPLSKASVTAMLANCDKPKQVAFRVMSDVVTEIRGSKLSDTELLNVLVVVDELAKYHTTIPTDRSDILQDWLGTLMKLSKEYAQFIAKTYEGFDADPLLFLVGRKPWRRFVKDIQTNIQVSIKTGRAI